MELHNLKPAKGAVKNAKRIGRGEGQKGGTSTRGIKEQNQDQDTLKLVLKVDSNTSKKVPKFGFTNRVEYNTVNLDVLQSLYDAKIKSKVVKDMVKNSLL